MTVDTARPPASRSWRALGARLAAIQPRSVGRGLIGAGVAAAGLWLAAASWPALVPYLVGGLVGYGSLPLVNTLDRVLPRLLASIVALLTVLALVAAILWLVVPPLVDGLAQLASLIPDPGQVSGSMGDIEGWIATLPEPVATVVADVFHGVIAGLGSALDGATDAATQFIIDQTLGLLATVNFVFGLFVLPIWMTSLMTSGNVARRQAFTFLPPGARADALAVARIVDRSASTYLRARLVLAVLTALFVYLGIEAATRVGFSIAPNASVALAVLLGLLQIIPELGLILGFLPIALVAAIVGPVPAAVLATIYVVSEVLAARVADTRVQGGARELPVVLLIPALVAMSQFGLLWLFLAAPIIGAIVDLARYGYGRLGDPSAPAGVIPGESVAAVPGSATAAPIPAAYRQAAAKEGVTSA